MRRLNSTGVRSYWIYDVLYGLRQFPVALGRIAKEYGSESSEPCSSSQSPMHNR